MEWLSDNLRYILLIGAIFLVLAGLFFGVRAISSGIGKKTAEAGALSDNTGAGASTKSTSTTETGNKSAGTAVSADQSGARRFDSAPVKLYWDLCYLCFC